MKVEVEFIPGPKLSQLMLRVPEDRIEAREDGSVVVRVEGQRALHDLGVALLNLAAKDGYQVKTLEIGPTVAERKRQLREDRHP